MIYWFTGQPAAGKTTLAKLLIAKLKADGKSTFHVDGDDLRELTLNKDYSKAGRLDNVSGAQKIAHYLHNEGYTVVVSLVSPYREQREELKTMLGDNIREFYVITSESRGRDNFHVPDYEPPIQNYTLVDTTTESEEESLIKIIQNL